MRRNTYFLLSAFLVFGCYQAKADNPPSFTGGHNQNLTVCESAGSASINSLLAIMDLDAGQMEHWIVVTGATHGVLVASASIFSTGGVVTPGGLTYTPTVGYSGTDSFSVRINDGTLSDTTTIHVLVNPVPGPITGVANVCRGLTTTLSDAGGGTWTSSSFIATVDPITGVVTGVATGNPTITYTISTGCKSTRIITVNPMPNAIAGSTFSVCTGNIIGLTDAGGGAWSSTNTSVATINTVTGSLIGLSADTVTINYTLATGCSSAAVVTVSQTPAPISGVSSLCLGSSTTLTETVPGGLWTSSNTSVATIVAGTVTAIAPGNVLFTYTLGACAATKLMTMNPLAPITGGEVICVGATTTLANIYGGGAWSSATFGVASVSATGTVSGVSPGNAVISYTLPTGCFSSVTVTVNPVPLPITGIAHICIGATTDLTETDGGGIWTSSNTTIATVDPGSGTVGGSAPGISTIIYSFSTGCKVSIPVTVNALPSAIGGSLSLCTGSVTSLFDGGGGVWSSTNTSIASINPATGVVSGVGAGMVVIDYVLSSGCLVTTTVTVNQTPGPITGPSAICLGATLTLGESVPGGVWTSSNTAIASVAGGTVTNFAGGTVTIGYSLGVCSVTKAITVNPIAPITGTSSFCIDGHTSLFDAAPGGVWSSSSPGIATINSSGFVTGLSPGTTVVSYSLSSGCFTSLPITVNPLPLPIEGIAHLCYGTTTALSDPDGGGTWTSSNTMVATINYTTGALIGLATGLPVITYTLSTGCKTTIIVTINALPAPIGGALSVCSGFESGLTEGSAGGSWSSSNTVVATIASTGYFSGLATGTSVIIYTLPTGCATNITITVNTTPSPVTGASSVCRGYTTTLEDGIAGGVWSSSSTLISINSTTGLVTGLTSSLALAEVTYTIGSCYVIGSILVNPITPIIGDTLVCTGATRVLENTLPGTWSSSNTSVATIAFSGIVHGLAPGATIITYTFLTGCFISETVVVNPTPGPIEGDRHVCIGSTGALSDSISGGTWASSATYLAQIDSISGVITPLATGALTVTYTLSAGCKVTAPVSVNPLPFPIFGPVTTCPGLIISMSDPGEGTWSSGNTTLATVNSHTGLVNALASGTDTISYTINGCTVISVVTINPLPPPIAGDSVACTGKNDTLSDIIGGGTWTTGNQTVAYIDSATGVVGGHALGLADIYYTLPTGCRIMEVIRVDACHVGVEQLPSGKDITVAPNPGKEDFFVSGSLASAADVEVSVTVSNMLGQVIYKSKAIARGGNINEHLQLRGNTASGMYILSLQSEVENRTFRIVVQQ